MSVRLKNPVLLVSGLLLLASFPKFAMAEAPKTISFPALQTLVAGLGLEDAGDKKTFIEIDSQGKNNIAVALAPSDDGTILFVFTYLSDTPKATAALIPAEKMLEYNDTHDFFFSVKSVDDKKRVYLEARVDASTLTPVLLRRRIDALVEAADESTELWQAGNWKAASAVK